MDQLLGPDMFPHPLAAGETPTYGVDVRSHAGRVFRVLAAWCTSHLPLGEKVESKGLLAQVAVDRTPEIDLIETYRLTLWLVLGSAFVLSGLVGYLIAHRGLRPLQKVTDTAARIRGSPVI